MNMTQEMLEIMIGKHIDGEITPSEQRLLEAELDKDPHAKELLAQLQEMHERCAEAAASELVGRGRTPDEIFERAWRQRSSQPLRSLAKIRGHVRFAVGLAAGLAIGLALHFVSPIISSPDSGSTGPGPLAQVPENQVKVEQPASPVYGVGPARDAIRNVDWYNFTDEQGNKWLVEGLREDIVRPAAYYEGL